MPPLRATGSLPGSVGEAEGQTLGAVAGALPVARPGSRRSSSSTGHADWSESLAAVRVTFAK
ncbi:hypothetical protein [Streptomyces vinaceus]|uniref:hypothetical protein n=1 Tax=Streptomyces vinaceus TaxID=1960 RepID=UPI0036CAD2C1